MIFNYEIHGSFEKFLALNPQLWNKQIIVLEWIITIVGTDTSKSVVGKALIHCYGTDAIKLPDVPTY